MALSNAVMDRIKAFAAKNPAANQGAAGVKPAANPASAVTPVRTQQEIIRRRQEAKGVMPVGTEPQSSAATIRARQEAKGVIPAGMEAQNPYYSRAELENRIQTSQNTMQGLTSQLDARKKEVGAAKLIYSAAEKNVYDLMSRAEQLAQQYSTNPNEETAALYQQVYQEYQDSLRTYGEARLGYERVATSYDQIAQEYNNALADYQTGEQQLADWRSTVRGADAIQLDLQNIHKEIQQQEQLEKAAALERSRAQQMGGLTAGMGTMTQQPYAGYLSPDVSQMEISPQMQRLLDRQSLLQEELQWSDYFAQEAENERQRANARDVQTVQAELDAVKAQLANTQQAEKDAAFAEAGVTPQGMGALMPYGQKLPEQEQQGQYNQLRLDRKALQEQEKQLETELYWSNFNRYAPLAEAKDFEDKSRYVSTVNGTQADTLYEMVNKTRERPQEGKGGTGWNDYLREDEIKTFNYLYATEGREAAEGYIDWLKPELTKRQRTGTEERAREYATEHPFLASAESVVLAPARSLAYVVQAFDRANDGEIDEDSANYWALHRNSAIRDQVAKNIESSGKWGKAGSFAYQTAMSMADFLYSAAITGGTGWSMAIMGTGAAADTVLAAKDRGLSDGQAFALGTVAGLAEAVTEKVSLDTLLDASLLKDNTLKYVLKNMLAEGSEEVASDVINLMADVLIAQDKSQWQEAIDGYMRDGMSESEAFGQAFKDQMVTMGLDFLGGAISGGVMGGGYAAIQNRTTGKIGDFLAGANLAEEDIRVMVEEGLQSGPETDAYHIAKEVQQKLDAGKTVTKRDLGRLHQANIIAIDAEQRAQQEQEARAAEEPQGLRLPTLEDETAPAQQPGQNNTLNGGTRYADTHGQQPGAGVLPGGSQRYDGAGTPEQIRQLARRSGATEEDRRAKADRVRIAAERRNLVQDLRTGKVSAQSLGIASGTENASLQVIPEERWDDGMRQKAQQVYEETGKPVTYVVGAIEVQGAAGKTVTAKGAITDTGIVVRADHIEYSAEQIADHEAYHGMKDLYKGMRDGNGRTVEEAMVQRIRERYTAEEFDRVVEQYILALDGLMDVQGAETRQQYEARIEAVVEEVLADAYAGMNMWNAGATQFTDTVREFMEENNISRKPGAENGVRVTNGPPAERYSYAGENAENANESLLQKAEQMRESGIDNETIRQETGWYVGMDGKWRFEIDDSQMELAENISNYMTLGELIRHNALFEAYPDLAEISVVFQNLGPNINGSYSHQFDSIDMNRQLMNDPEGLKDALIHELQHAIQRREGFTRGATAASWERRIQQGFDSRRAADIRKAQETEQELRRIQEEEPEFYRDMLELNAMTPDLPRGEVNWDTLEKIEDDPIEWQRYDARREELEEQYGDIKVWDMNDLLYQREQAAKNMGRSGVELYFDTAGEIEARDVANRRSKTPEQRKTSPPRLGNEDTVFSEGAGKSYAIAETDDGRSAVIIDNDILANVNIQNWDNKTKEQAKAEAKKAMLAFKDGVQVNGITYKINRDSRREFTRSKYTEKIFKHNPALFADKMRAANNVNEIIIATTNWARDGGLVHKRNDDFVDFVHGDVLIQAGTNQYIADVVVGITKTGKFVFYDVVDLTPTSFNIKKEPPTNAESSNYYSIAQGDPFVGILADKENSVNRFGNRYSVDNISIISEAEDGRQEEPARADIAGQNVRAYANAHRQDLQQQEEAWRKRMREADRERLQGIKKSETESLPTIAKRDLRSTLLNQFSVPDGQKAELGSIIDGYADRLLKKGSLTEEDRQRLFDRMYESGVMTLPADEYFETGRNMLRGGKVYVSDQIRQEFGDDWNDIRRKLFANKIYVTSDRDAGGIDSWNHELASLLPGLFHEEDTDLRDILERILYVAEQGREEKVSLAEYAARLAGQEYISERDFQENMERQMDWALRTFAEKAKLEIQLKDRTGAAVARERERGNQRLTWEHYRELQRQEKQRQERQEKAEAAKARKELRELQQKTLKTLRWLNKNRKRAPEELRDTWDEVLGDIDLLAVGAANEMNWSDKYHATWKDLAQMYKDAQSNDPNFLPSDDLKHIVDRLDATKIGDMDLGALQDLYKAAVGLRTEFYNRNNLMNDEMHRLFAEVYEDIKGEMSAAPEKFTGKAADKFFNAEQLTPMNLMQRMGGWDPDGTFYSMAKQLEKGERDMRRYHVQAQQMLQEFLEENQEWVKKADGQGKDAIWYELEVPELVQLNMGDKPIFGDTVKVAFTPAQKVHMYLESKNIDNLRHMTGGRTFADRKLYSEGKRQEAFAQGTTIRLAPETVKKIVSDLTDEEMALARLLEQYYNTFATGEINRVSNILNGYDKAMGKNYAPIYTNKNYNKTEFGVFDVTAEGVGNLKERQHSKNPSMNIGAFDAFERHVDHTARYVGMAIPVRNWNTLMNWQENHNSMWDVLTHKWGLEAKKQIEEIINALQAGEQFQKDSISTLAGKIQSNYISAIFGANPGIVLKQLGSIPMASAYLGAANAPKLGQLKNIDRDLISKYTKELDWRLMGYATPETKQLKDNPNWSQSNKVFRFVFGGEAITAMDGWAASTLWPWAENKVRKEHPELEIGTQEQIDKGESPFYKKVAEEFENALSRSQSVSDEIHQSHLRKSKNPITRAFTMFRSDSAQTYNAIRQKIGEAQFYARTGAKEKAVKAAKRAVGEAFGAMLINASWASAVSFLMALWKNKGKNYRDDEDELSAASVAGEMISDIVGSMAGVTTGGEELYDFVGNILTGEKWYNFETPGMEQLNDLMEIIYESGSGMRDLIAGGLDIVNNGGDLGRYFDDHSGDILGNIKQIAAAAAQYVAGLPASNVEAYLLGALKWVSPKLGAAYDDLFSDSGKASLAGMTGDALEGRIGSILDQRGISKTEDTASTLAGLYEAGHKAAMPGDVPTSVSVDGEQRKLSPYQQQTYDAAWSSIVSEGLDSLVDSALFRSGDADLQEKMLKNLYSYATDKAKEAVFDGYMVQSATVQIAKLLKEDVSLSDVVAWRTVSSEMKALEKMNLLKEWIIDPDAKAALVGSTLGWELQTETGKPSQYAKFLYSLENGMSVDEYLEVYTSGGNVDQYLEMMYEGVDHDAAQYYAEEAEELVPLENKGKVEDIQKWRVAIDASQSEEQQMTMLYILMKDSQYQNVEIAYSYGVKPGDYVRLQELLPEYDLDHSGGYKQTEIQAAINGLAQETKLTDTEKAALWQLVTGSTSSKKNPFGKKVGQKIIDEKKAAKDAPKEETDDISFADAVMQQLMGR